MKAEYDAVYRESRVKCALIVLKYVFLFLIHGSNFLI